MAQYVYSMIGVGKVVPPKKNILKDISLSFFPGAKIGVLGLNGAGKSTLLRIMAGLDADIEGEAIPQKNLKIGYLPQEPALDVTKDVRGNIEEGVIAKIILSSQARLIGGDDFVLFEVWVKHLTNSLNTDALSSHIVSRSLAGKPSLVKNLTIWAKDQSKWLRRAASMSFVPLVREGRFVTDALSVSDVLIEDSDYFVQQGVGNLLMEMTRLNSDRVVEFLLERKDRANPLVLRIASTKLKPEQRTQILNK